MRVFVIGTGRCGTTAFAKACSHITNFTCGHETNAAQINDLEYPDNHIEVDGHLQWYAARLAQKYHHDKFVLLDREREACVASLSKRARSMRGYAALIDVPADEYRQNAETFYDNQNANLRAILPFARHVSIDDYPHWFPMFWEDIGAEGDLEAALNEFTQRHNASE